jgi:hypothetical protein
MMDDDDGRYNEVFTASKKEYKIRKFRNRASKKQKKEVHPIEKKGGGGEGRFFFYFFLFLLSRMFPHIHVDTSTLRKCDNATKTAHGQTALFG